MFEHWDIHGARHAVDTRREARRHKGDVRFFLEHQNLQLPCESGSENAAEGQGS